MATMRKFPPMKPGDRFSRLVILSLHHIGKHYQKFWNCKCDCGAEVIARSCGLRNGDNQSCGCLHSERVSQRMTELKTTHGKYGTPEYRAWSSMVTRCTNPKYSLYHRYGGRGIVICERWKKFENFFADMGIKPTRSHSLGRINNDGNYEPVNCRWETPNQQSNNTRRNVIIAHNGKTLTISQWAIETGIKVGTIYYRNKNGWPVDKLFQPTKEHHG